MASLNLPRKPVVVAICLAVAALQYLGVPLFGRTFDPLDLVMYATGAIAALAFERVAFAAAPRREPQR
ncbi:MAG: hypothetical protein MUF00_20745 [Gemmatimonadaceae bacterium]|nr:hypothetical protein [Gemmatimonadaceae bacterium]